MAFGQELGVSAVQMAAAASTLCDGQYRPPRLVHGCASVEGGASVLEPARPVHVFRPDIVRRVRGYMARSVEEGACAEVRLPGIPVAGKTGTAQCERFAGEEVHSYAALAPAEPGADARAALKQTFGFDDFRPNQEPVVRALLTGKDALAVMPTGAGKSLCYQLPSIIADGCAIVISPLIALMKDQVDALEERGVAVTLINSTLTWNEQKERLDGMKNGAYHATAVSTFL